MVLPFGNWALPDGKLVVDESEKYLRRRNLRVIFPRIPSQYMMYNNNLP